MAFEGFFRKIQRDVVDKAITGQASITTGTITKSYVEKKDRAGGGNTNYSYVDVVLKDGHGGISRMLSRVPIMKIGGIQTSLPVVGATAVVCFVDNDVNVPFLLGYIESENSSSVVNDFEAPELPPDIIQ